MHDFQPGDLAACYGTDWVSRAISYGTSSLLAPKRLRIGPSHVAVICEHHGSPLWVESTSLCDHPCVILRTHVRGAQAHLPEQRITDYTDAGGRVDLYRLAPIHRLSGEQSELLTRILVRHFIGRMVDYDTGGALISGTRIFKRTRLLPRADLNKLFCSEMTAAIFQRLGKLPLCNPTGFNPATFLRSLVRCGIVRLQRSYVGESA